MKHHLRSVVRLRVLQVLLIGGILVAPLAATAEITTPEEFFGFQMGADKKLARWDKIVEYFELLETQSDRIQVTDLGPSTEGNPYLLVIISSPENMANLERLREVSRTLADPRGIPEEEIRALVAEGKAVVSQSYGLHATEVAGTQTTPELAHEFLTRDDEETQRILDNTILLMFPCFNPDGQIMVTDWYRKTLGTEYEGVSLPWLYHKYTGHDNNRDGDFLNMIEAVYNAKILYRDWKPQAYVDHHQMGGYGARFYVPPYSEPIRPYADPLMWRELSWYGAHIAYKLEENDLPGVLNAGQYPGWGHFGWHWITPFHNIAGMLTEAASASLATPLYVHPEQLRGGARQFPDYEPQSTIPSLWQGGWWRVRDIIEYQKVASWAIMDLAARNRETVLWNGYLKAKRQTERGAEGTPKAYVVPAEQHDPLTARRMINTLMLSDIEVQKASTEFSIDGMQYGASSYVISLAQPKMGIIRNLLGETHYPDNEWTRSRDGAPLRPYDTATHTMGELMGVRVDAVDGVVPALPTLTGPEPMLGSVPSETSLLALDGRLNASFKAVNLLLDRGVAVRRVDQPVEGLRQGDFVMSGGSKEVLEEVSESTGVGFTALATEPEAGLHDVKRMRVGMYHRYRGGNMDEGWTRFLLEQFAFPYTSLKPEEINRGNLGASYDVIVFPDDTTAMITGDEEEDSNAYWPTPNYPPEYMGGVDEDGVEALKTFVEGGGRLVTLGEATDFAIEKFDLKVRNALEKIDSKDFYCPGSTLEARFDNSNPYGYGMPSEGLVLFWNSPAFEITPSRDNNRYEIVARYADRDLLQSGWLIGEEHLTKKAAMVSAQFGEGEVLLIGFPAQHRAQTHGTFKLLFNTMLR